MSVFPATDPLKPLITALFRGEDTSWAQWQPRVDEDLIQLLAGHGLVPVLYNLVHQTGCFADWPEELRTMIADMAKQEAALELARKNELMRMLASMEENEIHPLLFKGSALGYSLYPAPGMRPRSDHDLLIAKADRSRVAALMKAAGYQPLFEVDADFLSAQTVFYKIDGMNIRHAFDVHWEITNLHGAFSRAFEYSHLMETARPIPALGDNARTLSNIDALLLACYHRAVHYAYSGEFLIWLYDIHLLLQALADTEVDTLMDRSRTLEIVSVCKDAIITAREWFNTPITEEMVVWLNDPEAADVSSSLLQPGRDSGIKSHALMTLKALPSWRERIGYLLQNLFPPVDYMMWRYHLKHKYQLLYYYCYRMLYGVYVLIKN